jgi:nicotinamide-nucleotide amidase
MSPIRTAVISIGNELLLGKTVNTNLSFLATELALIGLPVSYAITIQDEQDIIASSVTELCRDYDIVITTGGLGPTADDITKRTIADCFGKALHFDEEIWAKVQTMFQSRGLETPAINRNQALVPDDFVVLENARGTAPGLYYRQGSHSLFVLPGVPVEMKYIFQHSIRGILFEDYPATPIYQKTLHTSGISESALAEKLADLVIPNEASMAWLPQTGRVDLRFYGASKPVIDGIAAEVQHLIPEHIWGNDDETPFTALQELLIDKGLTLSVAESCTGGNVQKLMTELPGSSKYLLGGAVTYSNELKTRILGVSPKLLAEYGAVSTQCAEAMAVGIKNLTNSDLSISITGIAGPTGGDDSKPVGTVCFGYSDHDTLLSVTQYFNGDRETIRLKASEYIVLYLLKKIRG